MGIFYLYFERLLFSALVDLIGKAIYEGIESIVSLERAHVKIRDQINDTYSTRDKHDKLLRVVIMIDDF